MYRGKQSKKRNNLQYIHRFMYIFIYIYLYSNFCSVSCCFWTTILCFYFSHVNLQRKVEANEERGALHSGSRGRSASPPSFHWTWKHGLGERHEWLLKQTIRKAQTASTPFFQFSQSGEGQSKRAHSVAIRDTRHMTFSFRCYCWLKGSSGCTRRFCTNQPAEQKWSSWSPGLHCTPRSGALLCRTYKQWRPGMCSGVF